MKWFNEQKISVRLILGFILVAVITGCLGIYGIYMLRFGSSQTTKLWNNNAVGIQKAGIIAESFQKQRVATRDILLNRGANRDNFVKIYQDEGAKIQQAMDAYEKTITSEQGRAAFDELKRSYTTLDGLLQEIQKMALNGQEDAGFAKMKANLAAATAAASAVSKLLQLSIDEGNGANDLLMATTTQSIWIMIIVVIVSVLIAFALGIFISRSVNSILGKVTDRLQAASNQVSAASGQLSGAAQQLAEGSSEQAASIEETSATMEETSSMMLSFTLNKKTGYHGLRWDKSG